MLTLEFMVETSAYHEAGHAVVGVASGLYIEEDGVSIDGKGLGACDCKRQVNPHFIDPDSFRSRLDAAGLRQFRRLIFEDVTEALAGWLAEYSFHSKGGKWRDDDEVNDAFDNVPVRFEATSMYDASGLEEFYDEFGDDTSMACLSLWTLQRVEESTLEKSIRRFRFLEQRCDLLIEKHWAAIETVAKQLLDDGYASHEDVEAAL